MPLNSVLVPDKAARRDKGAGVGKGIKLNDGFSNPMYLGIIFQI